MVTVVIVILVLLVAVLVYFYSFCRFSMHIPLRFKKFNTSTICMWNIKYIFILLSWGAKGLGSNSFHWTHREMGRGIDCVL